MEPFVNRAQALFDLVGGDNLVGKRTGERFKANVVVSHDGFGFPDDLGRSSQFGQSERGCPYYWCGSVISNPRGVASQFVPAAGRVIRFAGKNLPVATWPAKLPSPQNYWPAKQNEPCRKTPAGESAWLVCDLTPDTGATARCCHAAEFPGTSRFSCRQQLRKVPGEPVTESLNGGLLNNFLAAEEA